MKTQANTKPAMDAKDAKAVVADSPISAAIKAIVDPMLPVIAGGKQAVSDASTASKQANDNAVTGRLGLVLKLVDYAVEHKPDHALAMQGVDAAIASFYEGKNSDNDGTYTQFRAEVSRAIHPDARDHVKADLATAEALWKTENDAIKAAEKAAKDAKKRFDRTSVDTPLHNAFARAQFVVLQANGMADHRAAGGEHIDDMEAFCDNFVINRKKDPKNCQREVDKALATLEGVARFWESEHLQSCLDYLKEVDIKKLAKAADEALARKERNMAKLRKGSRVAKRSSDAAEGGKVADGLLDQE